MQNEESIERGVRRAMLRQYYRADCLIGGNIVMTKPTKQQIQEWRDELRAELKGVTLTTVLRGVSASGMTRYIDVYRLYCDGGTVRRDWLSYRIAAVLGWQFSDKRECIVVKGCGMDMGFHLVNTLSYHLHDDGYAIRQEWL